MILENLKACADQRRIWTRAPLVPGFSDDPGLTDATVDLAEEVKAERC